MKHHFYSEKEYREKQSTITKANWQKGVFDFIYRKIEKICARKECGKKFEITQSDPKIYCSQSCAAIVNNIRRGPMPKAQKIKIGNALRGRENPHNGFGKGDMRVPRIQIVCANPKCQKVFLIERWMKRKYCSNQCTMAVVGGQPTSPKASRGKAGIRKDISRKIYFYSRWEANYARLLNYLNIKWEYEPKTFDLVSQNYTPDFYLPKSNDYVEIKNFLWEYSKIRDRKFRELYPNIKLKLLLKEDYLKLERKYSHLIKNWEYKNSPFIVN